MEANWECIIRPGFLGRRRDATFMVWDAKYGPGNWKLLWAAVGYANCEFEQACKLFYERSYVEYFARHPEEIDEICSYSECIDNALTNIESGCDYMHQEAFSTHIQDIAVRNVLQGLGRCFQGPPEEILTIRSADSNGYRWGPGNIRFYSHELITLPSHCPKWANRWSVEDFWQSNKWLAVKR